MPISHIHQPEVLVLSPSLRLHRFWGEFAFALPWYQDRETLLLVDGKEEPYDLPRLERMYRYLDGQGELYFIEALQGKDFVPVGDVTFRQEDMPIVLGPDHRRRGLGRQVVSGLIARGRALGFPWLQVEEIYRWNPGSRHLFQSLGFRPIRTTDRGACYRLELTAPGAALLRPYTPEDLPALEALFYDTVHTVCTGDYTPAQLDAWAPGEVDRAAWNRSLLDHDTLVALLDGVIAGFGDMDETGYLDRLYVHRDFQHRGIATALVSALEARNGGSRFTVHASRTARDFFLRRGYRTLAAQEVERRGQRLTNFSMEKSEIPPCLLAGGLLYST